jgi:dihydrofolate reductase
VAALSDDADLTVTISLILAMAENGVIGRGGRLPWHLPADLKRFKALTTGHTIVMGRKTFESIGEPLPNRRNVILTRNVNFHHDGVIVVHNLADAFLGADEEEKIFVAGGAEVYRQAIPQADRVYQTLVHSEVDGDICFADFNPSEWDLLEDEFHAADSKHAYPLSFRLYKRPKKGPVS